MKERVGSLSTGGARPATAGSVIALVAVVAIGKMGQRVWMGRRASPTSRVVIDGRRFIGSDSGHLGGEGSVSV